MNKDHITRNGSAAVKTQTGLACYSKARLGVVAFGAGMIISVLKITCNILVPATTSSAWSPMVTAFIVALVSASLLHYFSTGGRDQQLLRRNTH